MNDLHKMFEQLNPNDIQKQRVWESINEKKAAPRKSRHIGRTMMIAAMISASVLALSLGINAASGGRFFEPLGKLFFGDIVETHPTEQTDFVKTVNAVYAEEKRVVVTTEPEEPTENDILITEPEQPTTVLTETVPQTTESATAETSESINETTESVTETTEPTTESTTPTERVIETLDPNEVISGDYIYLPLSKNTAAVAEYLGNEKQVTIPSEIDGYKIVKIGYGAFICKSIKEVVIPEGVTEIERDAFYACHNLLTVTLPETLVTIGEKAFDNTNLHSVVIPDSVESIGAVAIASRYLSDVKIGKGIKTIGINGIYSSFASVTITGYINTVAFDYARSHDMKFVSLGNAPNLPERNYLYSSDKTEAVITEYIGDESKVTIPSEIDGYKVVAIGESAFKGNAVITEVAIPDGVTEIEAYAFKECVNLAEVTLPETLVEIGIRAFESTALQSIMIPDSVETIDNNAFAGCSKLADVKIGTGIKIIGRKAFEKTDIITISGYVDTVAYDYAYTNDIKFISLDNDSENPDREYIYSPFSDTEASLIDYIGNDSNITIPSNINGYDIVIIDGNAFKDCRSLESVVIPENVVRIEQWAFKDCINLKSVEIGRDVIHIDDHAFEGCNSLSNITVNQKNTVFDSRDNCNAIIKTESDMLVIGCADTVIPSSAASIGSYAFISCPGLTSVEVPSNIKKIYSNAFVECVNLEEVALSEGLTLIDNGAFSGCVNLKSINIPDSVSELGLSVFTGCTNLRNIELPDKVTTLNNFVFDECTNLESVRLSPNTGVIGDFAFYGCSSLKTIILPESVRRIGSYVFMNCDSLTDIYYEGSEYSWGNIRFGSGNDDLQNVTIHFAKESPTNPPTEPATDVTDPTTKPVEPTTEPTEPATEALQPTTSATEPTESAKTPEVKAKKTNKMKVTVKDKKVKAKKLKKAKVKVKAITVKKANGAVTFKKFAKKSSKYLTVNAKTGKITVKKGTKKGVYKIKVKITAKGTKNYKPKTVTKTIKIKVK